MAIMWGCCFCKYCWWQEDTGLGGTGGEILRAPPKTVLAWLKTFRICGISDFLVVFLGGEKLIAPWIQCIVTLSYIRQGGQQRNLRLCRYTRSKQSNLHSKWTFKIWFIKLCGVWKCKFLTPKSSGCRQNLWEWWVGEKNSRNNWCVVEKVLSTMLFGSNPKEEWGFNLPSIGMVQNSSHWSWCSRHMEIPRCQKISGC